jgi:hypothetical protein
MSQLFAYFANRATNGRALGVAVALVVMTGCDRPTRSASTDSLLARDLTLAAASAPPQVLPSLGDTAANPSSVPPAAPPVARPTPSAPRPRAEVAPARTRVRPTPTPTPTPTPAERAPVEQAPVETAPQTPAPSPADAGTAPAASGTTGAGRGSIGSGTRLAGRTNAEICSLANRPGDRLVATLSADVVSADGTRLAAGTPILIEMAPAATPGEFAFLVKSVHVNGVLIPVQGAVSVEGATTERRVSKGDDKGKVVGGAIAGAILGRVLGGGTRGTVIGAAGGAAAGTIAAARNSVTERCLPPGATLTVTLSAPLVLSPGAP